MASLPCCTCGEVAAWRALQTRALPCGLCVRGRTARIANGQQRMLCAGGKAHEHLAFVSLNENWKVTLSDDNFEQYGDLVPCADKR